MTKSSIMDGNYDSTMSLKFMFQSEWEFDIKTLQITLMCPLALHQD
jgi:hypothetical protein